MVSLKNVDIDLCQAFQDLFQNLFLQLLSHSFLDTPLLNEVFNQF